MRSGLTEFVCFEHIKSRSLEAPKSTIRGEAEYTFAESRQTHSPLANCELCMQMHNSFVGDSAAGG